MMIWITALSEYSLSTDGTRQQKMPKNWKVAIKTGLNQGF
jgi:hypothetical protein